MKKIIYVVLSFIFSINIAFWSSLYEATRWIERSPWKVVEEKKEESWGYMSIEEFLILIFDGFEIYLIILFYLLYDFFFFY